MSVKFSGNALIVEDNQINQMVLKAQLLRLGLNVDIAENGAVGLALINKKNFNIVFMDIQMPVMDGRALSPSPGLNNSGPSPTH